MQVAVPLWRVPFGLSFTLYPREMDRSRIYHRCTNPTSTSPVVKIACYEDGVFDKEYSCNIKRDVYIDVEDVNLLLPHITYRRNAY